MIRVINDRDRKKFISELKQRNAEDYNDVYDAVDKIIGMERDDEIRKEAGVMYG